jgi:hypothetical protein
MTDGGVDEGVAISGLAGIGAQQAAKLSAITLPMPFAPAEIATR